MLAFIFSGQGAQYVGMGMDIYKEYECSRRVFDEASETLGFNIKDIIFEDRGGTLNITENTQPAILTMSIACMMPLIERGIVPDVAAGLSLGEYSAYILAGAIPFRECISLVRKRGRFMQEAVPLGVGAMAAIIGLENTYVLEALKSPLITGIVEPANFNCPGQLVIAGEAKAVEEAMELCRNRGARKTIKLPVSAPFHCSMLKPAGKRLATELENIAFSEPEIPVVSNVTAEYNKDKSKIKDMLIRQVSCPVRWEESILRMIGNGVDTFIEIGPGKVLSGFIKKIDKNVRTLNVEDIESLGNTMNGLTEIRSFHGSGVKWGE